MKLNDNQRNLLAESFKDLANYSVVGLIFGYVTATNWRDYFPLLGALVYIVLHLMALYLIRGGKK